MKKLGVYTEAREIEKKRGKGDRDRDGHFRELPL